MKLNKKTILTISGISIIILLFSISATVVLLTIGVGLGVGLNGDETPKKDNPPSIKPDENKDPDGNNDPDENKDPDGNKDPGENKDPDGNKDPSENIDLTYRIGSYAFTELDLKSGSVEIRDATYKVIKDDNKYYLEIPPRGPFSLSPSTLRIHEFKSNQGKLRIIKENSTFSYGTYHVPFMDIGYIKIINGTIYGGFVPNIQNSKIVGYVVNPRITNKYPNGYEIGSFNEDGTGGVNMLKLQKFKDLTDDIPATTEENSPTTTVFGFFPFKENNERSVIRLGTNFSSIPRFIGFNPNAEADKPLLTLQGFQENPAFDLDHQPYFYDVELTTIHQRTNDIDFVVQGFKRKDGSDFTITLKANDPANVTKEVNLDELYLPLTYSRGERYVDFIGILRNTIIDDRIHLPNSVLLEDASSTVDVSDSGVFNLPKMKLSLKLPNFKESNYATATRFKDENELLINVEPKWLDYFIKTANLQEVKNLAKKYGITIRFKVAGVYGVRDRIFYGANVWDPEVPEVLFILSGMDEKTQYIFNKYNQISPFKYKLKEDLNDDNSYGDIWRSIAKIKDVTKSNINAPAFEKSWRDQGFTLKLNDNVGKYGFYPFSTNTPIIAYNKDYLPNGFDFRNGDLASFLYNGNVGNAERVRTRVRSEDVDDLAKNSFISPLGLFSEGPIWANNYYNHLKEGQTNNQQDLIWRASATDDSYYSLFADENLKNNLGFQKWVNYHKSIDPHFKGEMSDLYLGLDGGTGDVNQFKRALFNGHIGGLIISPGWVNNKWKNGEFLNDDTMSTEEKQNFVREKIGFQPLPISNPGIEVGAVAALSATLQYDPEKQELAEMFLYMLTNKNRALEFNKATSMFLPKKDIDDQNSNDEVYNSLTRALNNTSKVNRQGIDIRQFYVWKHIIDSIDSTTTYQDVVDRFKDEIINREKITIKRPIDP